MIAPVFTLDEASERMRTGPRVLARHARKLGSYFTPNGRDMLFTVDDLAAIQEEMRCHSHSPVAAESGTSAAQSADSLSSKAREFLTSQPPRRSARSAKRG